MGLLFINVRCYHFLIHTHNFMEIPDFQVRNKEVSDYQCTYYVFRHFQLKYMNFRFSGRILESRTEDGVPLPGRTFRHDRIDTVHINTRDLEFEISLLARIR